MAVSGSDRGGSDRHDKEMEMEMEMETKICDPWNGVEMERCLRKTVVASVFIKHSWFVLIYDRKALLKSDIELEYIDAPFVVRAANGNVLAL